MRKRKPLTKKTPNPKPIPCDFTGCKEPGEDRHFCKKHARYARGMVKRGECTWEELEAAGVAKRKNKEETAFKKWLKGKAEEGRKRLGK